MGLNPWYHYDVPIKRVFPYINKDFVKLNKPAEPREYFYRHLTLNTHDYELFTITKRIRYQNYKPKAK